MHDYLWLYRLEKSCSSKKSVKDWLGWRLYYLLSLEMFALINFDSTRPSRSEIKLNKRYALVLLSFFVIELNYRLQKKIDFFLQKGYKTFCKVCLSPYERFKFFSLEKGRFEITFYPGSETKHCRCKSVNACRPIVNRRRILWGFAQLNMIHWLYHGKLRGVSKS